MYYDIFILLLLYHFVSLGTSEDNLVPSQNFELCVWSCPFHVFWIFFCIVYHMFLPLCSGGHFSDVF